MRIEQIRVFKFSELSEQAKQRALQDYRNRNDEIFWQYELTDSLKKLFETANIKLRDYSLGLARSYIKIDFDDKVGELAGARAIGWLENNLLSKLRITRTEYLRKRKDYFNWGYRIGKIKDCPLTGVCYDEDFLDDLQSNIKAGQSLKDAFLGLADCYEKILNQENDNQNSESYIEDHFEANDYEFTEDGSQF